MGWGKEELIPENERSCNIFCNCCLLSSMMGLMAGGVMVKMYYAGYLWRRYFTASRMFEKILLPKRTLPDFADTHPLCPS